jgi:subtilisin family serine protease
MKKIILTFIVAALSLTSVFAQILEDRNTLLVSFRAGTSRLRIEEIQRTYQPSQISILPNTGVQIWTFEPSQFPIWVGNTPLSDIIKVSGHVRGNSEVSSDPNYITLNEALPNDPNVACGLGLLPECKSYPLDICRQRGNNPILVAVTDCGIAGSYNFERNRSVSFYTRPAHTWFSNKIWRNSETWDGLDNDNNGYKDDFRGWNWTTMNRSSFGDYLNIDDNGHGTHVSGIVAQILDLAQSNQVQLMNLKTQDKNGEGSLLSLVMAIDYAVGKKVNIMNLSLSYEGKKRDCDRSVVKAIMEKAGEICNMLFVVAAGNSESEKTFDLDDSKLDYTYFPAYFNNDNMIVVGGSTCEGRRWRYSNYGVTSVDIAAPAELVFSSILESCAYKNGTSMAAPFVTATAALIGSKQRVWNWQQAKEMILSTATHPIGDSPILYNQIWYNQSVTRAILNIPAALSCRPIRSKENNSTPNELITNTLSVLPNPFVDRVEIKINCDTDAIAELSIQNAFGQVIFNEKRVCQIGENRFEWQSGEALKGIYMVKVQLPNQVLAQKIVKQ